MKKIFCILSILTIVSPVFADDEPMEPQTPTVYQTTVATAEYVRGAYDALTSSKQDKIAVTPTDGAIVTAVSLNADGKTIEVARTNEVTIPVGSDNSSTRAKIWVQ